MGAKGSGREVAETPCQRGFPFRTRGAWGGREGTGAELCCPKEHRALTISSFT